MLNKNLGALISWREGVDRLASLESNFLIVRQTKLYRLFSKIIKRALYLRKGLIRRVRAECLYMNTSGVICVAAIKKARYAPLKRKIDGLSAVIKEYRRKRLDLLKGKDPYDMFDVIKRSFILYKNTWNNRYGVGTNNYDFMEFDWVFGEYPFDRFDYFSHPKGFYVREKPILTPEGLILQPVFELLNRHGKDNNGNTRKN